MRRSILICFLKLILLGSPLFSQQVYSLEQALLAARANNPYLISERLNVNAAEADILTAKLRPNPLLNNQSLQMTNSSYFFPNTSWTDQKNRQIWWQLTKPVLLPGVRKNKIEFAESNVQMQQYQYKDKEGDFLYLVANKWIDAWRAYLLQLNMQQVISVIDSVSRDHTASGDLKTELLLQQLRLEYKSAVINYDNELLDLQNLMRTEEKIKIDTSLQKSLYEKVETAVIQNLATRPDILFLKGALQSSQLNIRVQKSLAFPTPEIGFIINPQNTIPYVGFFGTIQIPLFSRNQGEIKKSMIRNRQVEENIAYSTGLASSEYTKALRNYQFQKTDFQEHKKLFEKSGLYYQLTNSNLKKGAISLADYADAQKDIRDIQSSYFQSAAQYLRSAVQLLFVTGTLEKLLEK